MWDVTSAGLVLILVGFAVVAVSFFAKSGGSKVKGAGVIMIGPIPIVFGSDAKWASIAMILAMVLLLLGLLFRVIRL